MLLHAPHESWLLRLWSRSTNFVELLRNNEVFQLYLYQFKFEAAVILHLTDCILLNFWFCSFLFHYTFWIYTSSLIGSQSHYCYAQNDIAWLWWWLISSSVQGFPSTWERGKEEGTCVFIFLFLFLLSLFVSPLNMCACFSFLQKYVSSVGLLYPWHWAF